MIVPEEWLRKQKEKEREKKVADFQIRFSEAKNNRDEWKSVYSAYLASKIWQEIKNRILTRANYRCESCGREVIYPLEVHHKTYDRIGGRERENDVHLIEQKFIRFKYRKYCKDHHKSYSKHFKIPDWFQNWVWNGENEDELEYLDNQKDNSWFK